MTGDEFRSIIERTGHSAYTLEDRWGVGKSTIHRECQREEVRGLYEDAARTLEREHKGDSPNQ
jgi:IS30 family transposase